MLAIQFQGSKPSRDQGFPGRGGVNCVGSLTDGSGTATLKPVLCSPFYFVTANWLVPVTWDEIYIWTLVMHIVDTEDNVRWMYLVRSPLVPRAIYATYYVMHIFFIPDSYCESEHEGSSRCAGLRDCRHAREPQLSMLLCCLGSGVIL
jgi:hypothetical protein